MSNLILSNDQKNHVGYLNYMSQFTQDEGELKLFLIREFNELVVGDVNTSYAKWEKTK